MKYVLFLYLIIMFGSPAFAEDSAATIHINGGVNFWAYYLEHMNDPVQDSSAGGFSGTVGSPFRLNAGGDILFTILNYEDGKPFIQAGAELSSYSLLGYQISHQLLSILLKEDYVLFNAALRPVFLKIQGNMGELFYFNLGFGLSSLQLDLQIGNNALNESIIYDLGLITFKNEIGAHFYITDSLGIHTKFETILGITSLKSNIYNAFSLAERMLFSCSAGVFYNFY